MTLETYLTIEEQLSALHIPPEQQRNVSAIATYERTRHAYPENIYGCRTVEDVKEADLNAYERESDRARYLIAADGNVVAHQNFRALAGIKRDWLKHYPTSTLLAHRMGSRINFDLIHHLSRPQDEFYSRRFALLDKLAKLFKPKPMVH